MGAARYAWRKNSYFSLLMSFNSGFNRLDMRLARVGDARRLFEIANDVTVRANAFNHNTISFESHLKWFEAKLLSKDCLFYVYEIDRCIVAQTRYDKLDGAAEIDYSVAPEWRGHGLGVEILKRSIVLACEQLGVKLLVGTVFVSNIASARVFEKAGFYLVEEPTIQGQRCWIFERLCSKEEEQQ